MGGVELFLKGIALLSTRLNVLCMIGDCFPEGSVPSVIFAHLRVRAGCHGLFGLAVGPVASTHHEGLRAPCARKVRSLVSGRAFGSGGGRGKIRRLNHGVV